MIDGVLGWLRALKLADVVGIVQAIGGIASVVVAVVAVRLARRANAINTASYLQNRLTADLMEVLALARQARRLFRVMFRRFPNKQKKRDALLEWLQATEELGAVLRELEQLYAGVKDVTEAWSRVEILQFDHPGNDKLNADDATTERAMRLYDAEHARFTAAVGLAIRRLRDASDGPLHEARVPRWRDLVFTRFDRWVRGRLSGEPVSAPTQTSSMLPAPSTPAIQPAAAPSDGEKVLGASSKPESSPSPPPEA